MSVIRAVTLDVAGTLIVPYPSVGAVYAEVANAFGFDADAMQLEQAFPLAFAQVRNQWSMPYGKDEEDARRFWSTVIDATFGQPLPYEMSCELYDTFASARRWRVLPQVREAITAIKLASLPMSVVSNFDGRLVPLLSELEIGPLVKIVTSASVGRAKPDPAALFAACSAMQVAPTEVLHLGDSAREDGEMCAASGARWLRCTVEGIPLAELTAILRTTP
jgi:putative hydrolase of the HAD superfamily